jgi:hypothetical protein
MKPDLEFAEGIYTIITGFVDGADSVQSLESYYLANKNAIATMKKHSEEHYQKLIQSFKEAKDAINSNRVRQGHTDKVAWGEGQRTSKEEADRRRKERIARMSKTHPSARFWKK